MNTEQDLNEVADGGSALNDELEAQVDWAIVFEDKDRRTELFTDHKAAMNRFDALSVSWNCHLFKRVDGC